MAHLLRGKQAGLQADFSERIDQGLFVFDDLRRYGVSSQIKAMAYDPVQSLLAVGVSSSAFGPGQIYVFGRKRISVTLALPNPKASAKHLQFCADRLVCLDDRNELSIYTLVDKRLLRAFSPPGAVNVIATDATLAYVLLGMATGDLLAYDMDREAMAPFKVPCLWAEQDPRARHMPIVSLQFHPRDIGKLVIGYLEGAVVYSFKQNESRSFLRYVVPRGAPGGTGDLAMSSVERHPRLTHACWHPTGTFVLTAHEDSSLVFWDPKEGRIVLARTLTETDIDKPGAGTTSGSGRDSNAKHSASKTPIVKIAWCANQDPDDTALLIAGGTSAGLANNGFTLLELGRTPNYTTATWQILSDYLANPRRQRVLPTPPGVEVASFCLIPRTTPWFAGAHDPVAMITLLSSGELLTMSFPSGYPIAPVNQLPPSLTFVHPFVTAVARFGVERSRWLGLTESRPTGPKLLSGGIDAPRPLRKSEERNILLTGHGDATIRIWDVGHGDEIENDALIQADVSRGVGRVDNVQITQMSFSGASSELAAGLASGELLVFRWMRNKQPEREPRPPGPNNPGTLTDVSDRKDPGLTEGFHPFTLLDQQNGPVTAVQVSDVGFVAAGFEGGHVVVIDMRGPAIIFSANVNEMVPKEKSRGFRRSSATPSRQGYATVLEFSVMTLEDDAYSSILLHVGTTTGSVVTLKVLPDPSGRYQVQLAGTTALEDPVVAITAVNAVTGLPCHATPSAVAGLRNGTKTDGVILAATKSQARIYRPPAAKGASKSFDSGISCETLTVSKCLDLGVAVVGIFSDATTKAFSLPGLREIASLSLRGRFDPQRLRDAKISTSGDILGWSGPSEMALVNVWGTGENQLVSQDRLFNKDALIPPRPTISNFQWVSGTQYVTPADMDILIGGQARPQAKSPTSTGNAAAQRAAARGEGPNRDENPYRPGGRLHQDSAKPETWSAWATRNITERTEQLGLMGDNMDRLEENSSGFAQDVDKFVARQKRDFMLGAVKKGFGF